MLSMLSGMLLLTAVSSSPTYKLQTYGVGSGGTNTSSSPTYRLNGNTGEISGTPSANGGNIVESGSGETRQANVPLAPTLSNGSGTFYNKLLLTINTSGSDASDYTYSIAVSTNGFATTNYVQADGTLAAAAVYRSYSAWGGAGGSPVIGLSSGTTYQARVNAVQGSFTASQYGPIGSAATINPALSFSISPTTVSLGSLLPGTVRSGSSNITFAFSTNGAAGGSVYVAGANNGLRSGSANFTIAAGSNNLAAQNQGFGLQGLTAGQTSGGPFTINSPFNGTADNVGAESTNYQQLFSATSAMVGGSATASVKGKAATTTPSATDYSETLTFIASASY